MSKCPEYAANWRPQRAGIQPVRDDRWSDAIAFGSLAFVEKVTNELGVKVLHREALQLYGAYALGSRAKLMQVNLPAKLDTLTLKNTIHGTKF